MDKDIVKKKMKRINTINSKYNLVRVAHFLNFVGHSLSTRFPLITDVAFLWKHLIFAFIELSVSFARKNKLLTQLLLTELDYDVLDVLSGKRRIKVNYPARQKEFYRGLFTLFSTVELISIRKVRGEHAFYVKGKHQIDVKKLRFSTGFIDAITAVQDSLEATVDVYPGTYFLVLKRDFEARPISVIPYEYIIFVYESEIMKPNR